MYIDAQIQVLPWFAISAVKKQPTPFRHVGRTCCRQDTLTWFSMWWKNNHYGNIHLKHRLSPFRRNKRTCCRPCIIVSLGHSGKMIPKKKQRQNTRQQNKVESLTCKKMSDGRCSRNAARTCLSKPAYKKWWLDFQGNGRFSRTELVLPDSWTINSTSPSSGSHQTIPTRPAEFGLGFDLKWDLGWMNDTLVYFEDGWPDRTGPWRSC